MRKNIKTVSGNIPRSVILKAPAGPISDKALQRLFDRALKLKATGVKVGIDFRV